MARDKEQKIRDLEKKKDDKRVREKRSEDMDAYQRVFDARTISTLRKLLNGGIISELVGIISQGKDKREKTRHGRNRTYYQ